MGGWTFATTNYTASWANPVYLSFKVGAGYPANELDLWHYDGSIWTQYAPTDLTYDGTVSTVNYVQMSPDQASRNAYSYAQFALHAVKNQD